MRRQLSNVRPPSTVARRATRHAIVSHLDGEREGPLRLRVAAIVDLRHDLVAHVELLALDPRLFRRREKADVRWRSRGLARRFPKLGDLVELTQTHVPVGDEEKHARNQQDHDIAELAPERRSEEHTTE